MTVNMQWKPLTSKINGKTYKDNTKIQARIEPEGDCTMQRLLNMDECYAGDLAFGILDPKTTTERTLHDFVQSAIKAVKHEMAIRFRATRCELDDMEFDVTVTEQELPDEVTEDLGLGTGRVTLRVDMESFGCDTENYWMVLPQIDERYFLMGEGTVKRYGVELSDVTDF